MRQRIGLVVAFFVAAVICPRVSWAMDLGMFDDMARLDQRDYLKYLVKNTEQVLRTDELPKGLLSLMRSGLFLFGYSASTTDERHLLLSEVPRPDRIQPVAAIFERRLH